MKLFYTGKGGANIFVWVENVDSTLKISGINKAFPRLLAMSENGEIKKEILFNKETSFDRVGIWSISLDPKSDTESMNIEISGVGELYPFVIPGPGIMPSHFYENELNLLFDADERAVFYIDVPEVMDSITIAYCGDIGMKCTCFNSLNEKLLTHWMPDSSSTLRHKVVDINVDGDFGWRRIEVENMGNPYRFTEWYGLPIFDVKPPARVPYVYLDVKNEQNLDFRVTVFRNGCKEATWDLLFEAEQQIPLIKGDLSLEFGAGFEYQYITSNTVLNENTGITVSFEKTLNIPSNWIRGDHHVHSYFEDAGASPDKLTRAARANGLDYMFLTDLNAKCILENRLQANNKEEHFLALPGQELMNKRTHMNALNVYENIDISGDEGDWIHRVEECDSDEHSAVIMLNHPSHLPHVASTPWGAYFRSWWVAAKYEQIFLVENFDFTTWFDFLQRGRRLVGLWTTDTHDPTNYIPGEKCSFLNTGGKLDEKSIVDALKKGKVTNTTQPGTFLDISVNGKGIGEEVPPCDILETTVTCKSTHNINKIELVANGNVIKTWKLSQCRDFKGKCFLSREYNWVLARAYTHKGNFTSINNDQFLANGVDAFTNPVWIKKDKKAGRCNE